MAPSVSSPWVSVRFLGEHREAPQRHWVLAVGMQRAVFKLLFPFTKVFWEKALSSRKQEVVSCKKVSHSPEQGFFL